LRRPVDPADVAAGAATPEQGAEIYLASLLVVDETTTMERAYLDELARQLRLAPALSVTVSRTTTVPAALALRLTLLPLVAPIKLAKSLPLVMAHW
jgi:uncharacterized membrane protein YebE (DUF533 family)